MTLVNLEDARRRREARARSVQLQERPICLSTTPCTGCGGPVGQTCYWTTGDAGVRCQACGPVGQGVAGVTIDPAAPAPFLAPAVDEAVERFAERVAETIEAAIDPEPAA